MVNGRKIIPNITFKNIGIFAGELLEAANGFVSALISPAGVGIKDKGSVKDRLNNIT